MGTVQVLCEYLFTDPLKVGNSEVYINVPLRIVMMREINIKGSFRVSRESSCLPTRRRPCRVESSRLAFVLDKSHPADQCALVRTGHIPHGDRPGLARNDRSQASPDAQVSYRRDHSKPFPVTTSRVRLMGVRGVRKHTDPMRCT
jgi:hypothetical protein